MGKEKTYSSNFNEKNEETSGNLIVLLVILSSSISEVSWDSE
jgi:hypothetical protein